MNQTIIVRLLDNDKKKIYQLTNFLTLKLSNFSFYKKKKKKKRKT